MTPQATRRRGAVGLYRAGLEQSEDDGARNMIVNDDAVDVDMDDPVRQRQLDSMTDWAHTTVLG